MSRGIPNDPNASRKAGYHILTKDDLRSRIKEIEERIKRMDRREKALGDLKKWLTHRKLENTDVLWMIKQMAPKRAAKPVKSKLPLQPTLKMTGIRSGHFLQNGKLTPPKGDPEFRRRIMEARKARGWNSEVLGKKVGASHATISNWEAGRNLPKEPMRVKILKVLELPAGLGAAATREMEAAQGHNRGEGNAAAATSA